MQLILQVVSGATQDFDRIDASRLIIWISEGRVIGITPNVPAPTDNQDLPTYFAPANITHALEVVAGWSERNQIQVGVAAKF